MKRIIIPQNPTVGPGLITLTPRIPLQVDMVSEADPQECIIVRGDDQDFNAQLPDTLCAKIQPGQSATGKKTPPSAETFQYCQIKQK